MAKKQIFPKTNSDAVSVVGGTTNLTTALTVVANAIATNERNISRKADKISIPVFYHQGSTGVVEGNPHNTASGMFSHAEGGAHVLVEENLLNIVLNPDFVSYNAPEDTIGRYRYIDKSYGLVEGDNIFDDNNKNIYTVEEAKPFFIEDEDRWYVNINFEWEMIPVNHNVYIISNNVVNNMATGNGSHVEGVGTKAMNEGEHAEGMYNVSVFGKTIHTIGIGKPYTDIEHNENAVEVWNDGKMFIHGIGGYNGRNSNEEGVKSLQQCTETLVFETEEGEFSLDIFGVLTKLDGNESE